MILDNAFSWLGTRVPDRAGVDAVIVEARLVRRALLVRSAFHSYAGHIRIAFQASGTRANSLMADGLTNSLTATRKIARSTDWSTFLVSAGVCVQAVVIHFALYLQASHIGIAFVAFVTRAHRLVFNHTAAGMFSTSTRVSTQLVDTAVSFTTLVICCTARENRTQGLAA